MLKIDPSRPTRARGLKRYGRSHRLPVDSSRPTRARGLKLYGILCLVQISYVAPHAGAWIETEYITPVAASIFSRAPRGRVD